MENLEDKFIFWCPLKKSEDVLDPTTGEPIMRLGGIASTSDKDSDGEFLDPKGFDITPLLKNGLVNWHHQAREHPDTIIGEPSKAEIRPEGLYIETDLYPSSKVACDVWELANTLEKDSKTRRLGYSIEGRVLKRKSNDKNNPDYKHIDKAIITGVAITHMPKNPKTFANIIKGDIEESLNDEDSFEEKSSKKTTFTKAEVMNKLFEDIPSISIQKAEQIFIMLQKFTNMKKITDEDIQKAYDALGLDIDAFEKAKKEPDSSKKKEEKESEEKEESKEEDNTKKVESKKDDGGKEEEEEEEEKEPEVKKAEGGNRFDRIEKAITDSHKINTKYIHALGVLIKDASQKLDAAADRENELKDIIKSQDETISVLSEKMEMYGSSIPSRKSLGSSRPIERAFQKAEDNDITKAEDNKSTSNVISMSKNPTVVTELLDQATFAKGYDEEFSKACTSFEAVHQLPRNIISRMKNEYGVEIVK